MDAQACPVPSKITLSFTRRICEHVLVYLLSKSESNLSTLQEDTEEVLHNSQSLKAQVTSSELHLPWQPRALNQTK